MPFRQSTRSCKSAFTLVELLVVIGIIALLISVLLPALQRARAASTDAKCKSNLRSLGQAMMMYAITNNGRLPPGEMCGQSYSVGTINVTNLNIFWFERLMGERLLPAPTVINQPSTITCPAQSDDELVPMEAWRGPAAPADDPRRGRFLLSYGINNWLTISDWKAAAAPFDKPDGRDDDIGAGNKPNIYGVPEYPKVLNARYAAEKIVLVDTRKGFQIYHWAPNAESVAQGNSGYPFNAIDWRRHSTSKQKLGRANFLFADGHVEAKNQGRDAANVFNEVNGLGTAWGAEVNKKARQQWMPTRE